MTRRSVSAALSACVLAAAAVVAAIRPTPDRDAPAIPTRIEPVRAAEVRAAPAPRLPSYQVIFDDFKYTPARYSGKIGAAHPEGSLFGRNRWRTRNEGSRLDKAWYWRDWAEGCTLAPGGGIIVTDDPQGSVLFRAGNAFRDTGTCARGEAQLTSGFTAQQGTWAVRVRLPEGEHVASAIDFLQAPLWLSSGHVARWEEGGEEHSSWSELNFEWQDWFEGPGGQGLWGRALTSSADCRTPACFRYTHLSNGLRMYDYASSSVEWGVSGGIALRDPGAPAARRAPGPDFSCALRREGAPPERITDPRACMRLLAEGREDPEAEVWVVLSVQYDGRDATFRAVASNPSSGYAVHMERTHRVGIVSQPLITRLTQYGISGVLPGGQTLDLEYDWFYYASDPDLSHEAVTADVDEFRRAEWPRANLDRWRLTHEPLTPWVVEQLYTPSEASPHGDSDRFVVQPVTREHNAHTVLWTYREKRTPSGAWSPWRAWRKGGFAFDPPGTPHAVEVAVKVDDYYGADPGEFTPAACRSYVYADRSSGDCEAPEQIPGT